jgi:hypothetical protein
MFGDLMFNNYLECNAASASLSNRCKDSMDCSRDRTFGDLMFNNYLECNTAPGFSQQSLQGFNGLFGE